MSNRYPDRYRPVFCFQCGAEAGVVLASAHTDPAERFRCDACLRLDDDVAKDYDDEQDQFGHGSPPAANYRAKR